MAESSPLDPSAPASVELMTSEVEAVSSGQEQPIPLPILPRTAAPLAILSDASRQPPAVSSAEPETSSPIPLSVNALDAVETAVDPVETAMSRRQQSKLWQRFTTLGLVCLSGVGIIWMASRGPQAISAISAADLDFGPDLVPHEVSQIGLHNLSDLDPGDHPLPYVVLIKPTDRRQTVALRRHLPQVKLEQREPLGTLLRVDQFQTATAAAVYNHQLRRLGYNSWVEKRS